MSQAKTAAERGERALADHAIDPAALRDPLLPAVLRHLDEAKGGRRDRAAAIRRWEGNPVQRFGRRRYRWSIDWNDYADDSMAWRRRDGQERDLWRLLEAPQLQRDPAAFAERLLLPTILTESLEFLEETARDDPSLAAEAVALRDEAAPKMESDFARYVMAEDAWADTFALWQLSRHPHALDRLEPLAVATATRFATRALIDGARVLGTDYPFFDEQLDSASAHLASALWTLGLYPTLLPPLLAHLRTRQRPDGGWGDPGQPSDVLTTLAVADVLAQLDPGFTLEPTAAGADGGWGREAARRTVAFFARSQEAVGWWRAFDPETPWLTAAVCSWLRSIEQPFWARFRWPHLARWQRDRKTRVPSFAFYEDLAQAAAGLGALGEAPVEVAFLDLIAFGDWNKIHGQQRGDELLGVLAAALSDIPESLVVRDGGDEFLVIGKPGQHGVLRARLEAFLDGWADRCRSALPDLPLVEARFVLGGGAMRDALPIRELLGEAVGGIKDYEPPRPADGVMAIVDAAGQLVILRGRPKPTP